MRGVYHLVKQCERASRIMINTIGCQRGISTIVLILGIGSLLGPIMAGYLLNTMGSPGYLIHLGLTHFVIAVGVAFFMTRRDAVAHEDQTHYQAVPPRSTGIAMEAVAMEAEESQETEEPGGG